jgi:hypothetical protein
MTHRPASPVPDPSARIAEQLDGQPARIVAYWPITDDTLTRSQLEREARPRLDEMAKHLDAHVVDVVFEIRGDNFHAIADVIAWPPDGWDGERIEYEEPAA